MVDELPLFSYNILLGGAGKKPPAPPFSDESF